MSAEMRNLQVPDVIPHELHAYDIGKATNEVIVEREHNRVLPTSGATAGSNGPSQTEFTFSEVFSRYLDPKTVCLNFKLQTTSTGNRDLVKLLNYCIIQRIEFLVNDRLVSDIEDFDILKTFMTKHSTDVDYQENNAKLLYGFHGSGEREIVPAYTNPSGNVTFTSRISHFPGAHGRLGTDTNVDYPIADVSIPLAGFGLFNCSKFISMGACKIGVRITWRNIANNHFWSEAHETTAPNPPNPGVYAGISAYSVTNVNLSYSCVRVQDKVTYALKDYLATGGKITMLIHDYQRSQASSSVANPNLVFTSGAASLQAMFIIYRDTEDVYAPNVMPRWPRGDLESWQIRLNSGRPFPLNPVDSLSESFWHLQMALARNHRYQGTCDKEAYVHRYHMLGVEFEAMTGAHKSGIDMVQSGNNLIANLKFSQAIDRVFLAFLLHEKTIEVSFGGTAISM